MLKDKMKEVMQYNSILNQPNAQGRYKNYKCFHCKQMGHIAKFYPMDYKKEVSDMKKDTKVQGFKASKSTELITYPKIIHFSTTCMIKDTDLTNWDKIWYISDQINRHVCYKLDNFYNIKEGFSVTKLKNQKKFLFTYELGEVLIEESGKSIMILGMYYAPEVTLNILSLDLLEKQGFETKYDGNRCTLSLIFKDKEVHTFDEDRMKKMHNKYLQDYFESLSK
uniref:ARID DNA-binding domain-containing protein n=1 Tax=Tanacetum cinerariifolium TaxID=118510 RepID=A0A6L2N812_TANCI|nr:ARID DNA-binding domain-containing protein [Tanacetum cinerariifolium]